MTDKKIRVNFFQRRPRKGFSYSIESVFDDVRSRLTNKIEGKIYISECYNTGYFSKLVNIIQAAFRQANDVNHITGETHFLNFAMKLSRVILTIHDCGMMGRKTGLAKNIVQWLYLKGPVKKARFITTVSEATKSDIISYTNINPDRIFVIPVAVSAAYKPVPGIFNKSKPVILHIGTGYNKNLERLIEALKGINCHLSIIGQLSARHIALLHENSIEYSNEYNITTDRMLQKYIECDIMAFVSAFEGFGMPIIEANSVERVVVTSNISAMPEVAGNAALLVNPYSAADIRTGIMEVINNNGLRETLINNGRINKLRFDGDKIANMYFELYEKIRNSNQ